MISTSIYNSLRTWINACNWKIVAHLSLEATSYRGHKFHSYLLVSVFNSLVISLCVYFSGYEFVCLILWLLVCVFISLVMSLCDQTQTNNRRIKNRN
jgi:hypothetical protein